VTVFGLIASYNPDLAVANLFLEKGHVPAVDALLGARVVAGEHDKITAVGFFSFLEGRGKERLGRRATAALAPLRSMQKFGNAAHQAIISLLTGVAVAPKNVTIRGFQPAGTGRWEIASGSIS
jgi:hypothetical protein